MLQCATQKTGVGKVEDEDLIYSTLGKSTKEEEDFKKRAEVTCFESN